MKTKKLLQFPLKYFLIAVGVILVVAIVIASIFGFNTSVEFGGGTQFKINVSNVSDIGATRDNVLDVLENNNINVESSFIEDNQTSTYLVIRSTSKDISNLDQIKLAIAERLTADVSVVAQVEPIKGSLSGNFMLMLGIGLLVAILIVFFAGWLRYKLIGGATLALMMLGQLLLYFALIALTRIPLSSATLVAMVISIIITLIISISIIEEARSSVGTKQYEKLSEKEIITECATKVLNPLYFLGGMIILFCIVLLFVPNSFVQIFAVASIVGILSSVFIGLFMFSGLYIYLLELYNLNQTRRLSKNPNLVNKKVKEK